jgi:hypothetical protein
MIKSRFKLQFFDRSIFKRNWSKVHRTPLKRAGLLVRKIAVQSIRRAPTAYKSNRAKKVHEFARTFMQQGFDRKTAIKMGWAATNGMMFDSRFLRKYSKPGKPPYTRAKGDPLRRIFSEPFPEKGYAIIGPVGFGDKQPVPARHEFGARVKRKYKTKKATLARRLLGLPSAGTRQTSTTMRYPKRSFMRPALKKAKRKLPEMWRDSFNKSTIRKG